MRLTQNDIRYIINESAKRVLSEISIKDSYLRFYSDIKQTVFNLIVGKLNGGTLNYNDNAVLLPETKWALQVYRKSMEPEKERFLEDLYKLKTQDGTGYLDLFIRLKTRRMITGIDADLNKYKSIAELGNFVNSFNMEEVMGRTKGEMSNAVNSAANDIDVPYEDEIWKVVIPKTYEASCYWGKDTEWCTATRETDEYYNRYSQQGILYININKVSGEKYQFHFETSQFMDKHDEEVDYPILGNIKASEGLVDYYNRVRPHTDMMNLKYYPLGRGIWVIEKRSNGKQNIINEEEYPLCDLWFDSISEFYGGYAKVRIGASINYIDYQGNFLSNEWFDNGTSFSSRRGWAGVGKKYENGDVYWNILLDDGTIGCDFMWFDNIYGGNRDNAKCEKDGIFITVYPDQKMVVGGNKNHRVKITSVEEFYRYRKEVFQEYVRMRKEGEEALLTYGLYDHSFNNKYDITYIRETLGIHPDYHIKNSDLQ